MGPDKEASLHDYFISCLAAGTGLSPSVVAQHVQNAESVTHFIQDGSCTLLAASHTSKIQNDDDDGRSLLLSNSIHEASRMPDATTYLFVKSSNHFDLSETSVDEIKSSVIMIVSPANSNLFSTLRSSLDSIYAPMVDGCNLSQNHNGELKSDSDWHVTESAKHLIIELENELAFTTSPKSSAVATDVHDISSIRTPMDEIRFWESFDGDEKYASSANQLVSCFSEVKDTFQRICNGTLEQDEHSLTRGNNVDGHSLSETLSWVENEFGDRGNVEGALYNAFLLRCSEGEYIYSPKVRPEREIYLLSFIYYFAIESSKLASMYNFEHQYPENDSYYAYHWQFIMFISIVMYIRSHMALPWPSFSCQAHNPKRRPCFKGIQRHAAQVNQCGPCCH